ncbi:MAG: ferredoxin [Bacillota bacterium]|nr:MAG: ferredoxin [Bacillota bacterium]
MEKAKVYFIRDITPENIIKAYEAVGKKLTGKVAVKMHSGEQGNQNYLRPEFVKDVINYVNGTVVECNTAYEGARNSTEKHKKLIEEHEWNKYFPFDLLDEEGPDMELDIPNGKILKKNYVGKNLANYDSLFVLSHFKGHAMGGFGGALKQLSIGCASSAGKTLIHTAGVTNDQTKLFANLPEQDRFLEAMADAAASVVDYFKGNAVFVNVMKNISVDCDCDGNASAPCMKDVGILASADPVAVDQACLDLVYNSTDPGKDKLIARIESLHGVHTVEAAADLGVGTREYELIEL